MDFIKDGGLNCVRHFLFEANEPIEGFGKRCLNSPGKVVGQLCCVCKSTDFWVLKISKDKLRAIAWCGCNGSGLPLQIGAPGEFETLPSDLDLIKELEASPHCPSACKQSMGKLVIGIGYPEAIPPNGTVDAEKAVEIIAVTHCKTCDAVWLGWKLRLKKALPLKGNEPWLRRIQGLR